MAVVISNVRVSAPPTATGTGSVKLDVSGLNGPVDAVLFVAYFNIPSSVIAASLPASTPGADFAIAGLAPHEYILYLLTPGTNPDGIGAGNFSGVEAQASFFVPSFTPAPRGGCPDRSADNYDPEATYNDGSCLYSPPAVPDPVFEVPLLNPLRFVQAAVLDECEVFETPDNTLFCQQQRPGMQRRPLFLQPVAFCDATRVQVLTNYPSVEAIMHRLRDNQVVGDPQPLTKVRAQTGAAPWAPVELDSDSTGNTYVISATGGLAPSLLASARLRLRFADGGPEQTYRILRSGLASAAVAQDFLVLDRPWAAPPAGSYPAVSWELSGPGFNVWEGTLDWSGLPAGDYYVRLHAYDADNRSAAATSEPVQLSAAPPNTVVVEYGNVDNAFGMVFNTGIRPRLRVPGTFFRQKNAGTLTEHRNSDGTAEVLASTAQRLTTLEVYGAPAWLHEKLFLATRLDWLQVNGRRGHVSGAYEAPELRQYPLSAGHVDVEQRAWLGAGNGDDAGNDSGDSLLVLRTGGFVKLRRP